MSAKGDLTLAHRRLAAATGIVSRMLSREKMSRAEVSEALVAAEQGRQILQDLWGALDPGTRRK